MEARRFIASVFITYLLLIQSVRAQGSIENPDFENDTGWSFYDNGEYWTGEYSTGWASHGVQSYEIHIPPAASGCDNYPGENTYGEVFQDVDLSGVKRIMFDLRTFGSWNIPGLGPDYYHSVGLWVDGTQTYTREREGGEFDNQLSSITGFSGTHRLAFRMQGYANFCSTSDRGLYVDNVRFVTSIVYLPLNLK